MASSIRLALFGPPGAGKGTQAQLLKCALGVDHISSGDLFRFHTREGTELGTQAAEYMNKGLLVPDDLVIKMVLDKVEDLGPESGFILDGFPRTREQAVALDGALRKASRGLDRVLLVDVPQDELLRRLGGRFICRTCQAPYSLSEEEFSSPPACSSCGGELYQREDDQAEAVQVRVKVYLEQTEPVLDFYRQQGLLVEISGVGQVEEVNKNALKSLGLDSTASLG